MIRTPDQRLRVFISSTLQELAAEREAAREAVAQLRLSPVMFELGASPHAPRSRYRAYLEQSHVFVGIYWQRYGWVAPDMDVSGLEDEFLLSADMPQLLYIKTPAQRESGLEAMIQRIEAEGRASYKLFETPEELSALLADDLAHLLTERFESQLSPDPAQAADGAQPTNLPIQVTSFIGRSLEMESMRALLGPRRIVTLVGAGGCGKTRLALELAAKVASDYADGVWLAELAPISDQGLVAQTVAKALGVKERQDLSALETLAESVGSKRTLLLLDNCEHVLDACAALADELVRRCPHVQILATSREAMGIAGEQAHRLRSLSLPDPKQPAAPDALSQFEAVQLFVDRARLVRPDFEVTRANASVVASLCVQLDGIPLAIELAAARLRALSVEEIDARLDQRFRLLTGGSRTALPRQQTLRALVDWSYDLLSEREKLLLQRLSVFVGGWTLDAAEHVCAAGSEEAWEILDLLVSLADKSLVVAEQHRGQSRYRLLETVRSYAGDRLREGEGEGVWRERHRDCFLALAEHAEPRLKGPEQQSWLDRLESEHDNLRAAMDWCCGPSADKASGLRLAGALGQFWGLHGHFREGRERLSRALASDPTLGVPRARVLNVAGIFARRLSDYPAAQAFHEQSLAIGRELGDPALTANSLNNLGIVAHELGDHAGARALLEEALEVYGELGDRGGTALALNNVGNVLRDEGDIASAKPLYEESLKVFRELGAGRGIALALGNLAYAALESGDPREAWTLYGECLAIRRELGDPEGIAEALEGMASVAADLGGSERAARIWGCAERLREEIGAPMPPNERPRHERRVAAVRSALGDAGFARLWQEGRDRPVREIIEQAFADES